MKITEIKISLIGDKDNKIKAFAGIVIDDSIAIHEIKIIQLGEKNIISMPSKKNNENKWLDLVHPINNDVRQYLVNEILKQFNSLVNKKLETIKLPKGFYKGYDDLNINNICLYSENKESSTNQGELLKEYTLKNYSENELKKLENEMLELIGRKEK